MARCVLRLFAHGLRSEPTPLGGTLDRWKDARGIRALRDPATGRDPVDGGSRAVSAMLFSVALDGEVSTCLWLSVSGYDHKSTIRQPNPPSSSHRTSAL